MSKAVCIALAGEGGQGVQLVGEILAESAYRAGLNSIYIPNFGVEQRGGVSIAFVQVSKDPIGSPKFKKADILVPLSKRAVERTKTYIKSDTLYIYESSAIEPPHVNDRAMGIQAWDTVTPEAFTLMVGTEPTDPAKPPAGLRPKTVIGIPASEIARDELKPRVFNIIVLGAIVAASKILPKEKVLEAMAAKLGSKFESDAELRSLNYQAFDRGMDFVMRELAEGVQS